MGKQEVAMSIGMPVYNGAKYLNEAIDSLLSQTFTEFELIISDNASTDNTMSICQAYAKNDNRVRYIRQSENIGVMPNFQFVLNESRGVLFMWASADDRWDENWIGSIYPAIYAVGSNAGFGQLAHMDEFSIDLPHPANSVGFGFSGSRVCRRAKFYLAYEGAGKANLFYAIYPREKLQGVDLLNPLFDYHILFSLINNVAYKQVEGTYFHKRIHDASEGATSQGNHPEPVFYSLMKTFFKDVKISIFYLAGKTLETKVFLLLLIPMKILYALKFHLIELFSLTFKKRN